MKVTKVSTATSKANLAAAKKAVAAATKKTAGAKTGVVSGRVVLKVTTKKKKNKSIVFPGQQQPTANATKQTPQTKSNVAVKNQVPVTARTVVRGTNNNTKTKSNANTKTVNTKKATTTVKKATNAGVHTAEAIARDITHPKREEVNELLKAYSRGWITAAKFNEVLQKSLF